ncbi:MAG: integrase domain-containing protein [Endozoicomonas sp.]
MPKFTANRPHKQPKNFGFGGSLRFAGCNALKTTMVRQYHSVAAHSDRWKLFCDWAKVQGIREARQINVSVLTSYADYLRSRIQGQGKPLAVSTAQNRLSTCNCVLKALRGNGDISIKPAEALQAKRGHIRTEAPQLSREKLEQTQKELCQNGHPRVAALLGLCRELGLRSREAALLDCRKALEQAQATGSIDVERGTKGGRGKSTPTSPSRVERLVPVSEAAMKALETAAALQQSNDNLVPKEQRLPDFLSDVRHYSVNPLKSQGLNNRHDLRAAYACERYRMITGVNAPVVTGKQLCSKSSDRQAREVVARELGHNRIDVVASYIGLSR